MEIVTERLKITPCTKDKLTIAKTQGYTINPHISSHINNVETNPTLLPWGPWFVIRKTDGKVVGDIGFKGQPNEKNIVEVGYGLIEEVWNNGYATESVCALTNWAFSTLHVEKIVAETLYDSFASMRVLEKLHFLKVGETDTMRYWELTAPNHD